MYPKLKLMRQGTVGLFAVGALAAVLKFTSIPHDFEYENDKSTSLATQYENYLGDDVNLPDI